jgi:hypothetical protein
MSWVLGQGQGQGEGQGEEEDEEGLEFRCEAVDQQCKGRIVTNLQLSNNVKYCFFLFYCFWEIY